MLESPFYVFEVDDSYTSSIFCAGLDVIIFGIPKPVYEAQNLIFSHKIRIVQLKQSNPLILEHKGLF